MLADITFEQAARHLWGNKKPGLVSSGPIVGALEDYGRYVVKKGLIKRCPVTSLLNDALVKAWLYDTDEGCAHWMVWDARQKVIRDPWGYKAAFELTWFIEFKCR